MNLEQIFKEYGFESYYIGQGNLLTVMWQSGWEGGLRENGYIRMYNWIPLLSMWNYHNIVNQLYFNIKCKVKKKKKRKNTTLKEYQITNLPSSVQFSRLVVWGSLWPHGLQCTRPPCPSPMPEVYSNSCRLSQWCHPTISSCVIPFSSCLQSFPALGAFLMSQLFASGDQSIGVSASTWVLPMNIQDWFPLGLTGWISLQSKGLSRVFSNTTVQKHQFFGTQLSL